MSEIIRGLSSQFDDLLNLRTVANDAILAAVSTPQYKLRWVPPDHRESISALFMANVVGLASCSTHASPTEVGEPTTVCTDDDDDDDYGYGPRLVRLRTLSQLVVTRKVQSRSRSCTIWITPPRNFLLCWHTRM